MELCQEFLIELFFSYCKRPLHKRYQNVFNAECPICKEGKSAGRSRRLFYFPLKQYFYCHNCAKSWKPFEWVKEVTALTVPEILKRNSEKTESKIVQLNTVSTLTSSQKNFIISDLPENSIDLTDQTQLNYFAKNKVVDKCLEYCRERRLFTAINSCKKFYVSLEDNVHKNRLVIPFFNENKKVVCYQTRSLFANQTPKYLTKFGEKQDVFGLANLDPSIPYVFIFEGPIDSMFVKNGVAMASLSPTEKQISQLNSLLGFEHIYVFDNDKNNEQTKKKIEKYINDGKQIFVWPKEFYKFKDFNEICCNLLIDEIPWKFVVKNSTKGTEAMFRQKLSALHNLRSA